MEYFLSPEAVVEWQAQLDAGFRLLPYLIGVAAPVLYLLFLKVLDDFANLYLAVSLSIFLMIAGYFGLNILLREVIPEAWMSNATIAGLSLAFSIAAAVLIGRFLEWYMREPDKPQWVIEMENLEDDDMMPFDRKRKAYMERRKRNMHEA